MDKTNDTVNDNEDFTRKTWRDDVTFVVEGTQIYASKCVLAMYSPVFEAMFGSDFKEKENSVVELPDKKAKDLQCLYPTVQHYITEENVFQVLSLADEYQVFSLKEKCEKVIKNYISMNDGTLTTDDLLQCYLNVNRHCHTDIESLCVDELVRRNNLEIDSSKAVNSFSKDEIIELQQKIISEQEKRLDEINTDLVKVYIKSKGTDLTAFRNAKGIKLEHKIDNVFDPELIGKVNSKSMKLWGVKFYTSVSVVRNKDIRGQSDKYLSVSLICEFPDEDIDWSCDVQAVFILENTSTDRDQTETCQVLSPCHFTQKSRLLRCKLKKLSKFLSETVKAVGKYPCKFVVYILANQPPHEEEDEDEDEDELEDEDEDD